VASAGGRAPSTVAEGLPVRNLFVQLWEDDAALVALEYLVLLTVVGLGLIIGLAKLEIALNSELVELGNSVRALSQGYSIGVQFDCKTSRDGSRAIDTPEYMTFFVGAPDLGTTFPSDIDVTVCVEPATP
jgi:hypothetical protein